MSAIAKDQFDLDVRVATPGAVAEPDSISLVTRLVCTRVTCRSCTCVSCISQCPISC
ncbi:FDLD family class I lanthipeptide [Sphaerisporangium dianthi]|uniref:FDLD family class I lanthipeptide n=1 Tax=Sphaerisporangium dianthi TaxID=1436120 RepID=A0ABV9CND9_9ACTN